MRDDRFRVKKGWTFILRFDGSVFKIAITLQVREQLSNTVLKYGDKNS